MYLNFLSFLSGYFKAVCLWHDVQITSSGDECKEKGAMKPFIILLFFIYLMSQGNNSFLLDRVIFCSFI